MIIISGCNQNSNSPESIFNVVANNVKECNFEKVLPLLSSNTLEKPFGEDYNKLQNNCNNLVSNDNCMDSCSSNERLFESYSYSCAKVCGTDCNDKRTVLEIGCIFNTRNYLKHTTSFDIIRSEDLSENEIRLKITRTRDFEFSQVEDEDEVIDVDFIKVDNTWKFNSPLHILE
ncbi:hypothetical protein BVX95_00875 [archaeon D22]|nr:hypothetical protein BVX95_00875 [archaeon D22]